jgi:uncharacterized lipoprotein YddW (UPF0748 family)
MKRVIAIIGFYVLALLCAMLPLQQTAAPGPRSSSSQNAPVFAPASPSPTPSPEISEARDLMVQVRGRGDAYYHSSLEPRAEPLAGQPAAFDPLAMTIGEAHHYGIKVHAWINIYLVAELDPLPAARDHSIYKHPDWLMVPRGLGAELYNSPPDSRAYLKRIVDFSLINKHELEGLFVSPANPEVKDHLYNIWMDIATRYDVDGLHFDYVRYPNSQYDYSRVSIDRFRQEMDKNLARRDRLILAARFRQDPLFYVKKFPAAYADFQRDQVSELVGRIYKGVKSVKPNAIISAAVFANEEDAARSRFQDWKRWLQMGWLDVVCPMAYTPDTETFRKQLGVAMSLSSGRRVWGGIGAYKQPAESAVEKIRVGRSLGAQGFVLFSYDSSIKVSDVNPQGDYLEKVRNGLRDASRVSMAQ